MTNQILLLTFQEEEIKILILLLKLMESRFE
jgi:hypothetical protein